ncbi:hypothetical protein [uncultured Helicobacter sp.]|uniref:hypothetical protein n=1 Tax=uncultured Helicobacter sp. TaxID=175537 RepID=UPI003751E544
MAWAWCGNCVVVCVSMIACIEAAAVMSFALLGTRYLWLDIVGFVLILFAVFFNARSRR